MDLWLVILLGAVAAAALLYMIDKATEKHFRRRAYRRAAAREAALTPAELLATAPVAGGDSACRCAVSRALRLLDAGAAALRDRLDVEAADRYATGAELHLTAAITWLRHQILTGPADKTTKHAADVEGLERHLAAVTDIKAELGQYR